MRQNISLQIRSIQLPAFFIPYSANISVITPLWKTQNKTGKEHVRG